MAIRKFRRVVRAIIKRGGLIYIPVALFGFFAPLSSAQANAGGAGLTSVGFIIDQSQMPPVRSDLQYVSCGSEIENDINRNYNYEPFQQCPNDLFMIHLSGFVTVPEGTQTVTFWLAHDDGATLQVGDQPLNDWWFDTGCSWDIAPEIQVVDLTMPLDVWLYEYGGDTCLMLGWQLDGQALAIVPDSAFTQTLAVVPTTTTTTTTTLPPYFNAVENLTAIANENGSVDLDWDAPTASNVDIYAYSVSFYDLDEIGGTTSGGWGVWTNQGTAYSLGEWMFSGSNPVTTGFGPVRFGIKAGNQSCFSNEGVGPCVYGPETTVDVTVLDPNSPSTTTTEPETTTTTQPEPTTTTEPEPTTTTEPEPTTTTEPEQEPTTTTEPEIATTTTEPEPEVTTTTEVEVPVGTTTPEETVEETIPEPTEPPQTTPTTSEPPIEVPIEVPEDVQDAADTAVEDIFDTPISNNELAEAVDDLVANADTPEELTAVVNSLLDQELTDAQFATVIDSVFSEPLSDENFAAAIDAVFEDPTQLSDAQFEDGVTAVFDAPLSDEQFQDAVAAVFEDTNSLSEEQFDAAVQAVFDEPLSTEQFTEALGAVFDEPISDEKFDSIISAVLDEPISDEQFEELVNVLESDTVTEEQVSAAVDSVIENGVTEDQAVDLATSEKVLESIDGEQASEIFDTVPVSELTEESASAIVEAVQDAPEEVKEAFEEEINVFDGIFDNYVPIGSIIDVGQRRLIIGITAVVFAMPAPIISSRRIL